MSLNTLLNNIKNKDVIIYSAGSYGSWVYKILNKNFIKVIAFFDINAKQNDTLFDIPVYKIDDPILDIKSKKDIIIIVALVKDYKTRNDIFNYIRENGFENIIDAQSIRCHFVDFEKYENIVNYKDVDYYAEMFSDDISISIYKKNVKNHIDRTYNDYIENINLIQYFPDDIKFHKGYDRFVDCGGYIGDTIDQLLTYKNPTAVITFEPNHNIFLKLKQNLNKYTSKIKEIYICPYAISDKTEISFINYEGGSSSLNSEDNNNCVQCVSLDDILKTFNPTFIKMDIEGAELKAVKGAKNIIINNVPDLAICVYHHIDHLWTIPSLLNSWKLGYKFYLRTHNSYTMETVLYATSEKK